MEKEINEEGERWSGTTLTFLGKKSGCLCVYFSSCHRSAVVYLACAPVPSREVIDVCSIQKACWETARPHGQAD